ncbi:hypothetical protein K458DRAFT_43324 [Lentithecium fluviatile CBS 122367]|uniref:Uncharacterized protein n=1 Tax=Lentithecium fluviatile CBS 122367 TaxID=1168545 RepID=A0A6G1J021_9PLEO|nr:hypothetical protein K458DRAFT_43324 [Lentithecium fluviatile CBS 122367]
MFFSCIRCYIAFFHVHSLDVCLHLFFLFSRRSLLVGLFLCLLGFSEHLRIGWVDVDVDVAVGGSLSSSWVAWTACWCVCGWDDGTMIHVCFACLLLEFHICFAAFAYTTYLHFYIDGVRKRDGLHRLYIRMGFGWAKHEGSNGCGAWSVELEVWSGVRGHPDIDRDACATSGFHEGVGTLTSAAGSLDKEMVNCTRTYVGGAKYTVGRACCHGLTTTATLLGIANGLFSVQGEARGILMQWFIPHAPRGFLVRRVMPTYMAMDGRSEQ